MRIEKVENRNIAEAQREITTITAPAIGNHEQTQGMEEMKNHGASAKATANHVLKVETTREATLTTEAHPEKGGNSINIFLKKIGIIRKMDYPYFYIHILDTKKTVVKKQRLFALPLGLEPRTL